MATITLSIDEDRYSKLRSMSRATRLPMSELTRIALDMLWELVGDPENPSMEIVHRLYGTGIGSLTPESQGSDEVSPDFVLTVTDPKTGEKTVLFAEAKLSKASGPPKTRAGRKPKT